MRCPPCRGSPGRSWAFAGWPAPETRYRRLYLDPAAGRLLDELPAEPASRWYLATSGGYDRQRRELGRVVLEYPFERPADVIGYMRLRVWMAALDTDDLDVFVGVQKVDRQGQVVPFIHYAQNEDGPVALGWLRASHRELDLTRSTEGQPVHTHRRELKVRPGEVVPLEIEIWPSGTRFEAGERLRLANAEKILFLVAECYSQLRGGHNIPAALDCLGPARRSLGELARLDEALSPLLLSVEGAYYQVEEAARELAGYREKVQVDPGRLQLVEERLALIRNLKKKYGDTVDEILHYRENTQREFDLLSAAEERSGALEREVCRCEEEWRQAAGELSLFRREAALKLEKEITEELAGLGMGRVDFRVHFEEQAEISPAGREMVAFLISPNPGEPLKPLARIASGGELSRIMLAFGTILAAVDEVPTLVYDEVDAGIGGKTLRTVAEKLSRLAGRRQVICVTHAASVACYADTHYHVHKVSEGGQTTIQVQKLKEEEERLSEIARMLAGEEDSLTVEHARQLLRKAGKRGSYFQENNKS